MRKWLLIFFTPPFSPFFQRFNLVLGSEEQKARLRHGEQQRQRLPTLIAEIRTAIQQKQEKASKLLEETRRLSKDVSIAPRFSCAVLFRFGHVVLSRRPYARRGVEGISSHHAYVLCLLDTWFVCVSTVLMHYLGEMNARVFTLSFTVVCSLTWSGVFVGV